MLMSQIYRSRGMFYIRSVSTKHFIKQVAAVGKSTCAAAMSTGTSPRRSLRSTASKRKAAETLESGARKRRNANIKADEPQKSPSPKSSPTNAKFEKWQPHADSSPFLKFSRPKPEECKQVHDYLETQHGDAVDAEFSDPHTPETIPNVLDAIIVALLSAATSWNNAKRAMDSMIAAYGSVFAYDKIMAAGRSHLESTIRCGGLHIRKSKLIFDVLHQVESRGKTGKDTWDMNHLFDLDDEAAMKELLSFKGVGPKCAFVVMNWCLKRVNFTVDTHVFRLAALWGWIPENTSKELAQAHLTNKIPESLQFRLHFLMIQHGRECPFCRGKNGGGDKCKVFEIVEKHSDDK
jgi:endonuclease III